MAIEAQWMQNRTFSGREDRSLIAALFDEGVLDLTMFEVTESSPQAMTVDVSVGIAVVEGDDQSNQHNYLVESTAVEVPAVSAAPGSDSRIDIVVLEVRDANAGHTPGSDDAVVQVVAGTPAASPVAPATPDSAIKLAEIGPIGVGKVTILDADITDTRPIAGRRDTPGTMQLYSGATSRIPNGWLLCDGSEAVRADYPALNALYSSMGYPFGNGNGTTTFNVPDTRDRIVVAVGPTDFPTVGATGGASTVSLVEANLPAHTHTIATHSHGLNSHTHGVGTLATSSAGGHSHTPGTLATASAGGHNHDAFPVWYSGGSGSYIFLTDDQTTYSFVTRVEASAGAHTHTITGSTSSVSNHSHTITGSTAAATGSTATGGPTGTGSVGSGTAVDKMNPYLVVSGWIVRT